MKWEQADFDDQFGPPADSVEEVERLHCGERYMSNEMIYEERFGAVLWWCKNRRCNGRGFGFDILTVRDYLGEYLDPADGQP